MHQVVKLMQTCDWKSLAEKMDEYDKRFIMLYNYIRRNGGMISGFKREYGTADIDRNL